MSTQHDSEQQQDDSHDSDMTRREYLGATGLTVLSLGIGDDEEDSSFYDDWFGDEEQDAGLRLLDDGETIIEDATVDTEVSFEDGLTLEELDSGAFALKVAGVGDGIGAFVDDDGDGVAELQKDHADFGGGDARDIGTADAQAVHAERVGRRQVHPENYAGDDLGEKINNALADVGKTGVHIKTNGAEHDLTTTADLTETENVFLDLRGTRVWIKTTDSVGFDWTDSQDVRMEWGQLFGDETDTPDIGILHANADAGPEGPWGQSGQERNRFLGGNMAGHYNVAPVFHHGREITEWTGYYLNNAPSGYAFAMNRFDEVEIGGGHQTISSPIKGTLGTGSIVKTWMRQVTFFERQNAGDGCLYVGPGSRNSSISDCEMRSLDGNPCVIFDLNRGGVDPPKLDNVRVRRGLGDQTAKGFVARNGDGSKAVVGLSIDRLSALLRNESDDTLSDQPIFESEDGLTSWIDIEVTNTQLLEGVSGWEGARLSGDVRLDKIDLPSVSDWACDSFRGSELSVNGTARQSVFDGGLIEGVEGPRDTNFTVGSGQAVRLDSAETVVQDITTTGPSGSWSVYAAGDKSKFDSVIFADSGGDALWLDSNDCRVVGCHINGNLRVSGSQSIGVGTVIMGDVTFDSGSDNNDLTGCIIKGTVTNNGGSGNDW
jgi:hypothetical protein